MRRNASNASNATGGSRQAEERSRRVSSTTKWQIPILCARAKRGHLTI